MGKRATTVKLSHTVILPISLEDNGFQEKRGRAATRLIDAKRTIIITF